MDDGFLYSPMPNPRGGFTTRPVLGTQIGADEMDAAVSAKTGLPAAQCAQVFTAYLQEILAAASTSRWSPGLHELVRFNPVSGGSQPQPDDFHTAEDLRADIALVFTAPAIRRWREGLRLASQGVQGRVTPVVTSILCCATNMPGQYVSGGMITLRGQHLKLDRHDPAQGVFLTTEDGTETRCDDYANITRLQATALVPETLTGPLRVRVASRINGGVRSLTYTTLLQQVAAPVAS